MCALPPRPDEVDDMAGDDLESGSLTERATLDLSFDDDEIFGLWVAALRELLAEGQQRPAQYPTPYAPLHASAGIALRRAAPRGASTYEKVCPSSRPLLTTPCSHVLSSPPRAGMSFPHHPVLSFPLITTPC